MANPEDSSRPGTTPGATSYQQEPKDKQGTMGGQPPLNVPAGVQSTGHGGVLVEKGQIPKDKED